MRKGKVTILASVLAIAIASVAIGAGTLAYFYDTETSDTYTFTAGELSISVTGHQWTPPTNWVPGETDTYTIRIDNTGSVPIRLMLLRDKGVVDDLNFLNQIVITEANEWLYAPGSGIKVNECVSFVPADWDAFLCQFYP